MKGFPSSGSLVFKCCPLGSVSYTCTVDGDCLRSFRVSIVTRRFTCKSLVIRAVMQAEKLDMNVHTDLRLQHWHLSHFLCTRLLLMNDRCLLSNHRWPLWIVMVVNALPTDQWAGSLWKRRKIQEINAAVRDRYFTRRSRPLEQKVQFKLLLHSNGKVSRTCVWRETQPKKMSSCARLHVFQVQQRNTPENLLLQEVKLEILKFDPLTRHKAKEASSALDHHSNIPVYILED